MTEQEIRDNAPSGATHYNPNGVYATYYKVQDGNLKFYSKKYSQWFLSCMSIDEIKPL